MKVLHSTSRAKSQHAFTIIETMVAMAIMAVALAALMAASSAGMSTIKQARDDLRATQIMAQRLELVRLFTWSQVTNESYLSTATFTEYYDEQSTTNHGVIYSGAYSLLACPFTATYSAGVKNVRVTLWWTNGLITINNVKVPYVHTRTMDTLVCSNGLQTYIY